MMLKFKKISILFAAFATMLILFAGCTEKTDDSNRAFFNPETVNSFATSSQIATIGEAGQTYRMVIVSQQPEAWCSFDSNKQLLETTGAVGNPATLYFPANKTDQSRTVTIEVIFSNKYSTTLTLTQTRFYYEGWGEQPDYRENADFKYKTYYTTLSNGRYVRNYSICYDRKKHVSRWVAYPVVSVYTSGRGYQVGPNNTQGRTDAWAYDDTDTRYSSSRPYYTVLGRTITQPEIATSDQQYITSSYGSGGYQRGHMLPSASRYNTWNTNAQTFFATNMMPQNGDFNGGSWGILEGRERGWVVSDTLFVVTGTHFANSTTINNANGPIAVPSHCWKVMLRTRSGVIRKPISQCSAGELQAIGFLYQNASASKNTTPSEAACTVSSIEQLTGFNFFHNLDPAIASQVKGTINLSDWSL